MEEQQRADVAVPLLLDLSVRWRGLLRMPAMPAPSAGGPPPVAAPLHLQLAGAVLRLLPPPAGACGERGRCEQAASSASAAALAGAPPALAAASERLHSSALAPCRGAQHGGSSSEMTSSSASCRPELRFCGEAQRREDGLLAARCFWPPLRLSLEPGCFFPRPPPAAGGRGRQGGDSGAHEERERDERALCSFWQRREGEESEEESGLGLLMALEKPLAASAAGMLAGGRGATTAAPMHLLLAWDASARAPVAHPLPAHPLPHALDALLPTAMAAAGLGQADCDVGAADDGCGSTGRLWGPEWLRADHEEEKEKVEEKGSSLLTKFPPPSSPSLAAVVAGLLPPSLSEGPPAVVAAVPSTPVRPADPRVLPPAAADEGEPSSAGRAVPTKSGMQGSAWEAAALADISRLPEDTAAWQARLRPNVALAARPGPPFSDRAGAEEQEQALERAASLWPSAEEMELRRLQEEEGAAACAFDDRTGRLKAAAEGEGAGGGGLAEKKVKVEEVDGDRQKKKQKQMRTQANLAPPAAAVPRNNRGAALQHMTSLTQQQQQQQAVGREIASAAPPAPRSVAAAGAPAAAVAAIQRSQPPAARPPTASAAAADAGVSAPRSQQLQLPAWLPEWGQMVEAALAGWRTQALRRLDWLPPDVEPTTVLLLPAASAGLLSGRALWPHMLPPHVPGRASPRQLADDAWQAEGARTVGVDPESAARDEVGTLSLAAYVHRNSEMAALRLGQDYGAAAADSAPARGLMEFAVTTDAF